MLFRVRFFLVLALFFTGSCLLAQSLEEVIDNSQPDDRPVIQQLSDAEKVAGLVQSFVAMIPVSTGGLPVFDRLLAFLKKVIEHLAFRVKEINMDEFRQKTAPTGGVAQGPLPKPAVEGTDSGSEADVATDTDAGNAQTGAEIKAPEPAAGSQALSGSEFMRQTEKMTPAQREEATLRAILAGNMPAFLKKLQTVEVTKKLSDGRVATIKYRVMPDYLAVGNDQDYVRMPMSPLTAQKIAEHFGCILPTTKMVDDIYLQARTKLLPQPMSGGKYPNWQSRMMKNEFYSEHQRLVESQCRQRGHTDGVLVAGHKKDVVISNYLNSRPKNVVIYGWHDARNNGKPIQGYGWSHENTYADYSHGIRLVSNRVQVDGKDMDIKEVLADKVLSELLSKEGPMKDTRACR